jgi:3-hydroxymyristoyl/3-hydroxydecanoyl-(acyl carrier protein) dehydratase
MMERAEIENVIPHRAPFLWIDRVEELAPGIRCAAVKWIDPEEPALRGHFPGRPILPGIFLIEAVAQTAGVMLGAALGTAAAPESGATPLLAAVNRFKFLRPVLPGQELRIVTTRLTEAGKMACIEGKVTVNGVMVAVGELTVLSA